MNLYVRAAGAVTALGQDAQTTVGSLRAGLCAQREVTFFGESEEDLLAAPIAGFCEGVWGIERYEQLAMAAIRPAIAGLPAPERTQLVIFLGLPRPERAGVPAALAQELPRRLAARLELPPAAIRPIAQGRAAVFAGLQQAQKLLSEGTPACLVGGVDVLVNGATLSGLSKGGQLKEQWDGFIPGEGAGFVWVSPKGGPGCFGRAAVPVVGVGLARDPADGSAAHPLIGAGYHQAYKKALADAKIPERELALVVNDVSGIRTAFEDVAMAQVRFFRAPREQLPVWHVASYLGELGAAVGAVELTWAVAALELGFAPGAGILLSAADGDQRAAVVLKRPEPDVRDDPSRPIRIGLAVPLLHAAPKPVKGEPAASPPGLPLADEEPYPKPLVAAHLAEAGFLGSVRHHHHAEGRDPWADIEGFEQRLIAHLDALAWLGAPAQALAQEWLLSAEGEEVAGAALCLLSTPPDGKTLERFKEALADNPDRLAAIGAVLPHLPRESAEPVLLQMLESDQPLQVAQAVRALTVAGWLTEAQLAPLLPKATPETAPALIEAAGAGGFGRQYGVVLKLAEQHADLLTESEWLALVSLTPPGGLRGVLSPENLQKRCPAALAVLCQRDAAPFYSVRVQGKPTPPALVDAVGWAGEVSAKAFLLGLLDSADDPKKAAAARALHRIFGAAPLETVEVPEAEPEPAAPGEAETKEEEQKAGQGEEPEDEGEEEDEEESDEAPAEPEPPPLKKTKETRLSTKRADWEKALSALAIPGGDKARLRHGQPWTKQGPLAHLARQDEPTPERTVAAWEYVLVNRKPLPFHPTQFVARQRAALAAIQAK
jgi:3-oxoacyl-[acyl-carrier-protein] synthase I